MATEEEKQRIIDSTDIVELVSEYVTLEKRGKNYVGLCPFHSENTPSFVVSPEKKLAHCFSCKGGGNPIQFLMQIKNIEYGEALSILAERNGIKISGYKKIEKVDPYKKLKDLMNLSKNFYRSVLEKTEFGDEAKAYLAKRGIDNELINDFDIGLSPKESDNLYNVLKDSGYLELDMLDCGLVDKGMNDSYHDLFVRRIMFPIKDESGDVIGYSARIFNNPDKNQPKYVNTRETVLYHKREVLYNLHLAKSEIRRKNRIILHEGQMDVIASYKSGLKEAVCSMGTAIGIQAANIIKKYTSNVIICYDGDKAGINASLKAINVFKESGFNVHLVLLPNGLDPDEYVLKYGKEEYVKYFESHIVDEYSYTLNQALINYDLNDASGLNDAKEVIFKSLANSNSSMIEEKYLTLFAGAIKSSLDAIKNDYLVFKRKNINNDFIASDDDYVKPKEIKLENNISRAQIRLFMYAKSSKEKALYIDNMITPYLDALSDDNRNLWMSLVFDYYNENELFSEESFIKALDEDKRAYYFKILDILRTNPDKYDEEDLEQCIEKIHLEHLDAQRRKISKDIARTSDVNYKNNLIVAKFANRKKKETLKRRDK